MKRLLLSILLLLGCGDSSLIQDYVELTLMLESPEQFQPHMRQAFGLAHPSLLQSWTPQRRSLEQPILSAGIMVYFVSLQPFGGSIAWTPSIGIPAIQALHTVAFEHEHDTTPQTIRLPVSNYDIYAIGYSGVSSGRGPEIVSEPTDHRCFRLHNINIATRSVLSIPLRGNLTVSESIFNNLYQENVSYPGCQFTRQASRKSPFSNTFKSQTIQVTADTEDAWTPTEFGICAPNEPAFFGRRIGTNSGTTYLRESMQHSDLFVAEWTDPTAENLRANLDTQCKLGLGKSIFVRLAHLSYEKARGEDRVTFMQAPSAGKCLNFQQTGYSDHIPLPVGSYNPEGQHLNVPIVIDLYDSPNCPTSSPPVTRFFLKNGLIHSEREAYAWTDASLSALLQPSAQGDIPPNHTGRMYPDTTPTQRLMIFLRQAGLQNAPPVSANHRVYLRKPL